MEARALAALLLVLLLASLYSKDGKRLGHGQIRDQHIDVFDKDMTERLRH